MIKDIGIGGSSSVILTSPSSLEAEGDKGALKSLLQPDPRLSIEEVSVRLGPLAPLYRGTSDKEFRVPLELYETNESSSYLCYPRSIMVYFFTEL